MYKKDHLYHYGVGHLDGGHSGRYPWGSGKDPKQSISGKVTNKKKFHLTDKQKRYIKIGATIAVTALAAYGGYKLYQAYGGDLSNFIHKGKTVVPDTMKSSLSSTTPSTASVIPKSSTTASVIPNKAMKWTKEELEAKLGSTKMTDEELEAYSKYLDNEYAQFYDTMKKLGSWGKFRDSNWESSLSNKEISTIEKYTGLNYLPINRSLRLGMRPLAYSKEEWSNTISTMDKALDKYNLKESSVFHRFSDGKMLGGASSIDEIEKLVGKTIHDNGYISATTSMDSPGMKYFLDNPGTIRYDIKTPAGKGIGAFVAGLSQKPEENEFLFNRGSDFEITGVQYDLKSKMTVVELLYKGIRRVAV